jgi:hypothetical protein
VIWYAPFRGLGEEEPFPRPPGSTHDPDDERPGGNRPGEEPDQSRRSSASTRITAYAAMPLPSPV